MQIENFQLIGDTLQINWWDGWESGSVNLTILNNELIVDDEYMGKEFIKELLKKWIDENY